MSPSRLAPLDILLEQRSGKRLPLPDKLLRLYGNLRLCTAGSGTPRVFSNFVTTLDGVVSLNQRGHDGGGDISGFSLQDRMVMGLLRAAADVVILGSASIGADPLHSWTPAAICPELAADYAEFEAALKKRTPAVNVIVSASGALELRQAAYTSGKLSALVVTTARGAKRLRKEHLPSSIDVHAVRSRSGEIKAAAILEAIDRRHGMRRVLVEGGPRLLGAFYEGKLIDEQFLSLAPQIAGRLDATHRPGLVMGKTFAPRHPLWGTLTDLRRGRELLFLRYQFAR